MLHYRKMNEEDFKAMCKECIDLLNSYDQDKESQPIDWQQQMNEMIPHGMDTPGNEFLAFIDEADYVVGHSWCMKKDNAVQLIAYFAVRPEYHRRGYATQMMTVLCEHARQASFQKIVLGVEKFNEGAIALYKKSGFEVLGEEDIRYIMFKKL